MIPVRWKRVIHWRIDQNRSFLWRVLFSLLRFFSLSSIFNFHKKIIIKTRLFRVMAGQPTDVLFCFCFCFFFNAKCLLLFFLFSGDSHSSAFLAYFLALAIFFKLISSGDVMTGRLGSICSCRSDFNQFTNWICFWYVEKDTTSSRFVCR